MKYDKWKQLKRKTIFDSKFMKVYEDAIELPNGKIIDDYSLVKKPDIIMIVATDEQNRLIVLEEYKYGADEILLTLPAGHINEKESPIEAAMRELTEETGYGVGQYKIIGKLYEYPTKDLHTVTVVRALQVCKIKGVQHEDTENIAYKLITTEELKKLVSNGEFRITSSLASLALSGLLM